MDSSKTSSSTYQFRVFLPRCETYAIRFDGSDVTGIYGPLDYREVLFSALPNFPYEDRPGDIAWVKSSIDEFVECDAECDENTIWI